MSEALIAVVVGIVQGVLEWIPVSSSAGAVIAATALFDTGADDGTHLALFLHGGTALSALAFYRREVGDLVDSASDWRPSGAFRSRTADLSFVGLAMAVSFAIGLPAYLVLDAVVTELTGGAFVALIGGLLVLTGALQRFAGSAALEARDRPDWLDAVLVGGLQGVAILPGVSRSGTTVSALLLRGHGGEDSFRLSFLLSIPAALAANGLILATDGIPTVSPTAAVLALATSAVVGYLTVGALVGLSRRLPFWQICVAFGTLGVAGGGFLILT